MIQRCRFNQILAARENARGLGSPKTFAPADHNEVGAHVRTHKADGSDIGKFMTPTLRELTHTGPYMHNGTFETLASVVAFYNAGGGSDRNKDPALRPLGLTTQEQINLVAFLEALSGTPLTGEEFVWSEAIPADYPVIEDWRETRN